MDFENCSALFHLNCAVHTQFLPNVNICIWIWIARVRFFSSPVLSLLCCDSAHIHWRRSAAVAQSYANAIRTWMKIKLSLYVCEVPYNVHLHAALSIFLMSSLRLFNADGENAIYHPSISYNRNKANIIISKLIQLPRNQRKYPLPLDRTNNSIINLFVVHNVQHEKEKKIDRCITTSSNQIGLQLSS